MSTPPHRSYAGILSADQQFFLQHKFHVLHSENGRVAVSVCMYPQHHLGPLLKRALQKQISLPIGPFCTEWHLDWMYSMTWLPCTLPLDKAEYAGVLQKSQIQINRSQNATEKTS